MVNRASTGIVARAAGRRHPSRSSRAVPLALCTVARSLQLLAVFAGAVTATAGACSVKSLDYLESGPRATDAGTEGGADHPGSPDSGRDDSGADTGGDGTYDASGMGGQAGGEATAGGGGGTSSPGEGSGSGGQSTGGVRGDSGAGGGSTEPGSGGSASTGGTPGGAGGGGEAGGNLGAAGAGGTAGKAGGSPVVLFVVGDTVLTMDDATLMTHLKGLAVDVHAIDDSAITADVANAAAGIVVSHTAYAPKIGTRLRDVTTGVLSCEPGFYPFMGMTDSNTDSNTVNWGTTSDLTSVQVRSGAGPLSAGLSGTVAVQSMAGAMAFGLPSREAILVAEQAGQAPAKWAIFGYETGAMMAGRVAAARRVGFYFSETSAGSATTAGWNLFDAALNWILVREK